MAAPPELPPLSFGNAGNEDLPIVLIPPSDDAAAAYGDVPSATAVLGEGPESDMRFLRRKNRTPELNVPTHPIRSMQDAFTESLIEVGNGGVPDKPKLRELDAKTRRQRLIEQDRDAEPHAVRWRYRPGQKQHEVWKLMSQISFGVYLLLNGMANNNDQVVTILQGHIDEIDEFLEVAMEDFEQATIDLTERIQYLRLPLEHLEVFEKVLEDRNYRAELIENNETIEHILGRTTISLKQYENDIKEAVKSTKDFTIYLADVAEGQWRTDRPDVGEIYDAMKGNTEGWYNTFKDLDVKAKKLDALISQLDDMVAQMQKMAGEVSRRTWMSIEPFTLPLHDDRRSSTASPPSNQSSTPRANSQRESVSTMRASSIVALNRLTIRGQLPPPLENPFGDPNAEPERVEEDLVEEVEEETVEADEKDEAVDEALDEAPDDGLLYILQPRTYTPALPEPLPSPMVKDYVPISIPTPNLGENDTTPTSPEPPKRSSLRQRVSLKANPPESIQIPPPNPIPYQRPRTSPKVQQPPDSAYGSDIERNRGSSATAELSPPIAGPVMPSPRSEQQTYHPVRASPHSPLQQRPHTSHNTPRIMSNPNPSYHPHHQRNAPSRLGGASLLSNVTTATYDTTTSRGGDGEKRLKKKRSAFGWLKKAFSLDEEEKATFEARKTSQMRNLYYDDRSSQFLDGRRVRPAGTR